MDRATSTSRVTALDGLRGWAALSVVFFHMTWETFGALFPVLRTYPFSFLGNGNLAVAIFFVLSGYVLTSGRWRRPDNPPFLRTLLRRYIRLEIPVAASVLAFYAIAIFMPEVSNHAAQVVKRQDWLSFINFTPDPESALSYALWRVYGIVRDHNYGPFLWTMAVELPGSFIVLGLSQSPRLFREPYSPLLLCTVLLLRFFPPGACMIFGALFALLERDRVLFFKPAGRLESGFATAALIAVLLAAAAVQMVSTSNFYPSLFGVLVFVGAWRSRPISALLDAPVSQWLGRVSFPLYVFQVVVLLTLTSWLIVEFNQLHWLNLAGASVIAIVSVAACLLVARLGLPVEEFALRASRTVGGRLRRVATA